MELDELMTMVVDFTTEMTEGDTDKKCLMTCSALAGYLDFLNIESAIVKGDFPLKNSEELEHYWLECHGFIIDPTANQLANYGLPEMPLGFVGEKPTWYPKIISE